MIRASIILEDLLAREPPKQLTLDWLTKSLDKHSFGLIVLLFALLAAAPGISILGALLLLIPGIQMIVGLSAPSFPRWIAVRPLPAKQIAPVMQRAVSVLRIVETVIHPRWPTPPQATKRIVGIVVMILTIRILLAPLPLSNVIPAVLIALISLAYLEEDGLTLFVSIAAGLLLGVIELGFAATIIQAGHHYL